MKKLLLTGATGFLGGAVLEKLLLADADFNYLLLVRATTPEQGLSRIRENLAKFYLPAQRLNKINIDHILLGDLAEPDSFINDPRIDDVTHVINCAAVASFGNNPLIWKVNVDGTLAFGKRMAKVAGLQRFIHVGTAMSCTPDAGTVVSEQVLSAQDDAHLVEYTKSKSAIERLLAEQCPNLPLVLARPSIVVGHTRLGCQPSSSIFWVFRMALMLRKFMCSLDDYIDVIPVDYCADALLCILLHPHLTENIYHISAGEQDSVSFAEIDQAMSSAARQKPMGTEYCQVDYGALVQMRKQLKNIFGPCNERLMLKAMRLYGSFAVLNVRFSNERLLSLGMPRSPRFTDYIACCVESSHGITIQQQMAVDFK
ncbi:nucleoside-diphosphate-sugar epimerase [Yersinia intermedia]|uniref:SDR family oxidoreductase n=1 Tax=Yersinia intermedia TaxID=631 RepID=UPI0005ACF580|nr:SDR family oxidoreductase [Yersinia intermedia]AJJ18685.1 3-beta hydroxysteroid dehydrogenase/isomerase family protein [Yersinia intermedia]MDA5511263.1 SDR family oxidoreductase [Yersinia intermedia]CNH29386.1 nucleoside-diphosphate-sugar epimerase [Yersinia intermedia]CQD75109.1 nucleoside-diphosphate-sugar epimerase [Yersinia intermedia]